MQLIAEATSDDDVAGDEFEPNTTSSDTSGITVDVQVFQAAMELSATKAEPELTVGNCVAHLRNQNVEVPGMEQAVAAVIKSEKADAGQLNAGGASSGASSAAAAGNDSPQEKNSSIGAVSYFAIGAISLLAVMALVVCQFQRCKRTSKRLG